MRELRDVEISFKGSMYSDKGAMMNVCKDALEKAGFSCSITPRRAHTIVAKPEEKEAVVKKEVKKKDSKKEKED